jgi:hypothetical protein
VARELLSTLAMKIYATLLLVSITACKSSDSVPNNAAPPPAPKPAAEPAAAPAPPAPAAKLVETDLSKLGAPFKGYVAMIPDGAKLEFDDPTRQIHLSDVDYVSISAAEYWEDGVAGLSKDKDNKNITKVSATEYRYERTPPLGTAWAVDVLVKTAGAKWSCSAGDPGTFTSAAMRDQIAAICNSIHKK